MLDIMAGCLYWLEMLADYGSYVGWLCCILWLPTVVTLGAYPENAAWLCRQFWLAVYDCCAGFVAMIAMLATISILTCWMECSDSYSSWLAVLVILVMLPMLCILSGWLPTLAKLAGYVLYSGSLSLFPVNAALLAILALLGC
jgi:hypothetical protein